MSKASETAVVVRFSVGELVTGADTRARDGWRLAGILNRERARLGTQAHGLVLSEQAERAEYQKELSLVHIMDRPEGRVEVHGRVDGVRTTPAGLVVEELKTTALASAQLEATAPEQAHAEQCGFYCTMLEQRGAQVHQGVLLYYSLFDGGLTRIPIEYDSDGFAVLLEDRVDARLRIMRNERERRERLSRNATELRFPHGRPRPVQLEMIRHVGEAAEHGRVLFCSAPTGTGKTAAGLFPMVRQSLAESRRLFFTTARHSQQELALETISGMAPPDSGLVAVQIVSKDRSCPMTEMRCVPGVCPYLTNFGTRLSASSRLTDEWSGGVARADEIVERALAEELCPAEVSLVLAQKAPVVVSDLNYVFHPRYRLRSLLREEDGRRPLLIVDEAHNLPDRARANYSARLSLYALRGFALELIGNQEQAEAPGLFEADGGETLTRVGRLFAQLCDLFEPELRRFVEERESNFYVEPVDRAMVERFAAELEALLPDALAAASSGRWFRSGTAGADARLARRDPVLEAIFDLQHFLELALLSQEDFPVVWFADGTISIYCLRSGPMVRSELDRFWAVLLMSATLTPFDYFAEAVGYTARDSLQLELESPFSQKNRALLFVPGFDTRLRQRSQAAESIAALIQNVTALRRGNYLAFFSSFAFRDEVVRFIDRSLLAVLVQTPAMQTEPLMARLRANVSGGSCLLAAVHGGVFAEGVDFPGDMALGAFIVGPGLPAVTVERELLRESASVLLGEGDGRLRAYVQPAAIRSVQAGGRVIRSETDRGFILLVDDRFAREDYRAQMPSFWQRELVETADPVGTLRAFWAGEK